MIPGALLGAVMRQARGIGDGVQPVTPDPEPPVEPGAQWQATHALEINGGAAIDESYTGPSDVADTSAAFTIAFRARVSSTDINQRPAVVSRWGLTARNGWHFDRMELQGTQFVIRPNNSDNYIKVAWDALTMPFDTMTTLVLRFDGTLNASGVALWSSAIGSKATNVVTNDALAAHPDYTGLPLRYGNESPADAYYARQGLQSLGVWSSALSDAQCQAIIDAAATDDWRGLGLPDAADLWHIEDTTPPASVPNLIDGRGALTGQNTNGDEVVSA